MSNSISNTTTTSTINTTNLTSNITHKRKTHKNNSQKVFHDSRSPTENIKFNPRNSNYNTRSRNSKRLNKSIREDSQSTNELNNTINDFNTSSISNTTTITTTTTTSSNNHMKSLSKDKSDQLLSLNIENPTKRSRLKYEFFPSSIGIVKDDKLIFYVCSLCGNVCKNYKDLSDNCNRSLLENRCKDTELCSLFREFIKLVKLNIEEFDKTEYSNYLKRKIYVTEKNN